MCKPVGFLNSAFCNNHDISSYTVQYFQKDALKFFIYVNYMKFVIKKNNKSAAVKF